MYKKAKIATVVLWVLWVILLLIALRFPLSSTIYEPGEVNPNTVFRLYLAIAVGLVGKLAFGLTLLLMLYFIYKSASKPRS